MGSNCNWEDELTELEDMIDDGRFSYAGRVLKGIRDWVTENEHITDSQKSAIKRARIGGTRSGNWEDD